MVGAVFMIYIPSLTVSHIRPQHNVAAAAGQSFAAVLCVNSLVAHIPRFFFNIRTDFAPALKKPRLKPTFFFLFSFSRPGLYVFVLLDRTSAVNRFAPLSTPAAPTLSAAGKHALQIDRSFGLGGHGAWEQ